MGLLAGASVSCLGSSKTSASVVVINEETLLWFLVVYVMEAFDSISFEEASSACREANSDINKAAWILSNLIDGVEYPSTSGLSSSDLTSNSSFVSSSSSTSSCSSSSEEYLEVDLVKKKGFQGNNKQKRGMTVTVTFSTLLGKNYRRQAQGHFVNADSYVASLLKPNHYIKQIKWPYASYLHFYWYSAA
ncbi:hypothetical protein JCGZ_23757 [Jatropha curcas]|uniref:At5g58720/SDE5-like UBA-like domain-containing protein n=1 Tax=Jatropha curcas TaxID=180498 RepID=A0A067LE88_JATCU|nr:hypothetical protein JCGZ_23757 [Jatropha curcas]